MAKRKLKRGAPRVARECISTEGFGKLFRPKKEPPSELELVAKEIVKLNQWIASSRRTLLDMEREARRRLQNERETLANLITEQRTKITRMEELSAMPQAV